MDLRPGRYRYSSMAGACRGALLLCLLATIPMSAAARQPRRDLILECMACHGEDGIARDRDVPHLAGQNREYLVRQLHDFQSGKRPHREMRGMSRLPSSEELEDIADFYASLPR